MVRAAYLDQEVAALVGGDEDLVHMAGGRALVAQGGRLESGRFPALTQHPRDQRLSGRSYSITAGDSKRGVAVWASTRTVADVEVSHRGGRLLVDHDRAVVHPLADLADPVLVQSLVPLQPVAAETRAQRGTGEACHAFRAMSTKEKPGPSPTPATRHRLQPLPMPLSSPLRRARVRTGSLTSGPCGWCRRLRPAGLGGYRRRRWRTSGGRSGACGSPCSGRSLWRQTDRHTCRTMVPSIRMGLLTSQPAGCHVKHNHE